VKGSRRAADRLIIWGSSGHALVVTDIIRLVGQHEIVGFLDDLYARPGLTRRVSPVLGGRECLDELRGAGVSQAIIAVGDCATRLSLAELACAKGFSLIRAIHPRAIIATEASVGPGTVVCAGVVVNPWVSIGANAIVNTSVSVDHECLLEDGVHIGPGAHLGGRVVVERGAWVGIGATLKDGVRIGAGSIVGAGAVVLDDVPAGVVAYGAPARVKRQLSPDGG
jgi:UDP-N-acetylbacillosamine N-acetyltransferase